MKRILNIIDTGGTGGAEAIFIQTSSRLDENRFHVHAIIEREGWLAENLRREKVQLDCVASKGSFNFAYLRALLAIARRERSEIIVTHLLGPAIYGALVGAILRIPVISILHGAADLAGRSRALALKKWILRHCVTRLVFVSQSLRDEAMRYLGLPASKAVVIPNGIDLERFRKSGRLTRADLGIPAEARVVGSVGNVRDAKDYETLLRAAALVCGRMDDCRFIIVGEAAGERFQHLLALRAALGLEEKVLFLGLRDDVADIMVLFDVFALSSSSEGFSIACVEAMAAGVPVVATRCGGPEEILAGGKHGVLVPVKDAESLAAALIDRLQDRGAAAAVARSARQHVERRYALPIMLRAYESLLGPG